jgi:hypothetical protein
MRIGVLPTVGGLYDQKPRDITKMILVIKAMDKHEADSMERSK